MISENIFGSQTKTGVDFQRGYFLAKNGEESLEGVEGVSHWHTVMLSDYYLRYCPKLGCNYVVVGDIEILMLGYALNPYDGVNDESVILENLALRLKNNDIEFYDYLNELSGRFVVIVISGEKSFVLQDATGLKTCFYTVDSEKFSMSSHPGLLGEVYRLSVDPLVFEITNSQKYHMGGLYLPGILSPYSEVKQLLANTQYNLNTRKVTRFFPYEYIGMRTLDQDFVSEVSRILYKQNQQLFSRFKVALSLTAGLDSRLSLSLLKNFKNKFKSFTYTIWGNKSHKVDASVAGDMANKYNFHHEQVKYRKSDGNADIARVIARNHGGIRRSISVHEAFKDFFPEEYVDLRSNVSEIFRCYWQKNPIHRDAHLPLEKILSLYKKSIKSICEEAWIEFLNVQDFSQERFYGYDPFDLFYWEHRMSNWMALSLLDADTSHETFIHYNNRKLLITFLSIPFEDRLEDKIPRMLIEHNWPELLDIPINPKEYISLYGD